MPVRITKPITLDQIATAAGLPTDESMSAVAGSLVGSLIAGVYPPASTRANHSMSEYVYSWAGVENQKLTPSDPEFLVSNHGCVVTISGDGLTMAETSYIDNDYIGAVRVSVWNGSEWVQQARLIPPYTLDQYTEGYAGGFMYFGLDIKLSEDGNTLMVTMLETPDQKSRIFVYTRSGTTWSRTGEIVPFNNFNVNYSQRNITMSRDGQLIFHGTSNEIAVYARSGNSWSLLPSAIVNDLIDGSFLSASSTGEYVTTYGIDTGYVVKITVFRRSGNVWNLDAIITPTGVTLHQYRALQINGPGTVIVCRGHNTGLSSQTVLVFYTRSGSTWTQQQVQNYYDPAVHGGYVVDTISMTDGGGVVAVGGVGGDGQRVTIWRGNGTLTSWTLSQTISNANAYALFPQSISLSRIAGGRLVIGNPTPTKKTQQDWPTRTGDNLGNVGVYYASGTTYLKEATVVGTGDTTYNSLAGARVSMTADGNRMFTTAPSLFRVLIYDRNSSGQWVRSSETLNANSILSTMNYWGRCLDVSADGKTVVVGDEQHNSGIGAVWVFMKDNSGVWSQQILTGTGYTGTPNFGQSVSISADGAIMVVGGPEDNDGIGAFWIFTRSGTTWTQLGSKRLPSGIATDPGADVSGYYKNRIGYSVTISADGNTIAVGSPYNSIDTGYTYVSGGSTYRIFRAIGATWVFTRSGTTWTQQGNRLIGTGYYNPEGYSYDGDILQGWSVSLSADGNTLAVGGIGDGVIIDEWFLNYTREGAVWVFNRSGTTWTQQGSKLAISGATSNLGLGNAVSLSASGNVLAVGANNYKKQYSFSSLGEGAGAVYTRQDGVWTNQTGILQGVGMYSPFWLRDPYGFGTGVKTSSSGRSIIFGGPGFGGNIWDFK